MRQPVTVTILGLCLIPTLATVRLSAQQPNHPPSEPIAEAGAPPLYDNLGTLHKEITTRSEVAQQYFDQGLRLTYAFNHDEAIKSFQQGIKVDSTCAMCYWGVAYALGPNINLPMDTSAMVPAYQAIQQAVKYSAEATPYERAYIEALAQRYAAKPVADRASLDSAWAKAIGLVAYAYPKDDDAATLYAEALMDLRPWNYWTNGGKAKAPSTQEQVKVLEAVLKRNPDHPGACHFYIHAVEASNEAAKALPCAQRLGSLMPGAGHLVHMPTHIYIKLGQWELAAEHNAHAVQADEQFISERHPTGAYPIGYYPHNFHVMWYALTMLGRSEDAVQAAQNVVQKVPVEVMRQFPPLEALAPTLLFTYARFSRWGEILREAAPPKDLGFATAAWHYARGLAYTGQGKLEAATVEYDKLVTLTAALPADKLIGQNTAKSVLAVAIDHLAGEMAAKQGKTDESVEHLGRAIAAEDELTYDEPPDWYLPIRQRMGAILLAANRPVRAEKIFREDLVHRPENGWSLYGLAQSLKAQNKTEAAAKIEERFEKAWKTADVQLTER
jgi:tetratricopeptide (TPR) repeat protein